MYNYIVTETDWNHWVNGWMGEFLSNFDEGKMEEMWYSIIPASHQAVTFSLSNVGLYIVQVWWTMLLEIAQHWDTCEGSVIISQRIDLDRDTYAQHPFVVECFRHMTDVDWLLWFHDIWSFVWQSIQISAMMLEDHRSYWSRFRTSLSWLCTSGTSMYAPRHYINGT